MQRSMGRCASQQVRSKAASAFFAGQRSESRAMTTTTNKSPVVRSARTERVVGGGNMMLEGMGNKGAIGKGQTIEAFINQRIRTEEAGYHLQKDNERLGVRAPSGPPTPAHNKPPTHTQETYAPTHTQETYAYLSRSDAALEHKEDEAATRLAHVRQVVEEQFAKYENPNLPREYLEQVAKAKERIVASFEKADTRLKEIVKEDPVIGGGPAGAVLEDVVLANALPDADTKTTRFTPEEWVGLVFATTGAVLVSIVHTLWKNRQDEKFARAVEQRQPQLFNLLHSLGWHSGLTPLNN